MKRSHDQTDMSSSDSRVKIPHLADHDYCLPPEEERQRTLLDVIYMEDDCQAHEEVHYDENVSAEDLHSEIERLRAERALTLTENETLRAELERLRADNEKKLNDETAALPELEDKKNGFANSFIANIHSELGLEMMNTPAGKVYKEMCLAVHDENVIAEDEGREPRSVMIPLTVDVMKELEFDFKDNKATNQQRDRKLKNIQCDDVMKYQPMKNGSKDAANSTIEKFIQTNNIFSMREMIHDKNTNNIPLLTIDQFMRYIITGITQQNHDIRKDVSRIMAKIHTASDRQQYKVFKNLYSDWLRQEEQIKTLSLANALLEKEKENERLRADNQTLRADAQEKRAVKAEFNEVMFHSPTDRRVYVNKVFPNRNKKVGANLIVRSLMTPRDNEKEMNKLVGPKKWSPLFCSQPLPEATSVRDVLVKKGLQNDKLVGINRAIAYNAWTGEQKRWMSEMKQPQHQLPGGKSCGENWFRYHPVDTHDVEKIKKSFSHYARQECEKIKRDIFT
ncbi:ORF54 [Haliotid herpesvirus 1]|nr:ORF2 [Haliotid herpesvirus 1]UCX57045.1 ORF54 [Haliotid herpesvirus 1]